MMGHPWRNRSVKSRPQTVDDMLDEMDRTRFPRRRINVPKEDIPSCECDKVQIEFDELGEPFGKPSSIRRLCE